MHHRVALARPVRSTRCTHRLAPYVLQCAHTRSGGRCLSAARALSLDSGPPQEAAEGCAAARAHFWLSRKSMSICGGATLGCGGVRSVSTPRARSADTTSTRTTLCAGGGGRHGRQHQGARRRLSCTAISDSATAAASEHCGRASDPAHRDCHTPCRPLNNGGGPGGSAREQRKHLSAAAHARPHNADLALSRGPR